MNTDFWAIVLGHLTADYLLQSKKMAKLKSSPSFIGFGWCLAHCLIYTACIGLFSTDWNPIFLVLVFLSHYPIDRYSLANKWLKVIGGRDILSENQAEEDEFQKINVAFACLVYAVADNTLHLILLWLIANYYAF